MNLVDAIRLSSEGLRSVATRSSEVSPSELAEALPSVRPPEVPMNHSPHFVRIELFLSADQIQHLLKDSVGAHRTIMTAHEVALLLRTTTKNVEHLAEEGKLPAFKLEDSWRFNRATVEEWLTQQEKSAA